MVGVVVGVTEYISGGLRVVTLSTLAKISKVMSMNHIIRIYL